MPADQKFDGITAEGVIGSFYNLLEQETGSAWLDKVSMLFDSTQEIESYDWLGMSPVLREWIGGRQVKGLRDQGLTITNKKYEATIGISLDDLRRDKTGQINVRISEFARRSNTHWNSLLSALLIAGEAGDCYDSFKFFAADHSEGDSGTQINLLAAAQVAELDVTTPASPTPLEMSNAILGVIEYMLTYLDDQGEPMMEEANEFLVMVPTSLFGTTLKALRSNLLDTGSGTLDNILVGAGDEFFKISLVVNARLNAWTTNFLVFRTDVRTGALIRQEEVGMKVSGLDENSEHAFANDEIQIGLKTVRAVGYGYWQYCSKSTLS